MLQQIEPYEVPPPFWTAGTIGLIVLGVAVLCVIGYLIYRYRERIAAFFRR